MKWTVLLQFIVTLIRKKKGKTKRGLVSTKWTFMKDEMRPYDMDLDQKCV